MAAVAFPLHAMSCPCCPGKLRGSGMPCNPHPHIHTRSRPAVFLGRPPPRPTGDTGMHLARLEVRSRAPSRQLRPTGTSGRAVGVSRSSSWAGGRSPGTLVGGSVADPADRRWIVKAKAQLPNSWRSTAASGGEGKGRNFGSRDFVSSFEWLGKKYRAYV